MNGILALSFAFCALPSFGVRNAAVTRAEAAAVFTRTDKIVIKILHLRKKPTAFDGGAGVATREQILKQFLAVYEVAQPKFKFTPPPQKSAPSVISFKDAKTKALVQRLEVLGFVDRYGPLATSKSEGLEPQEFGDAVGYFLARLAELTHTPSAKFSPFLMPG